MTTTILALTLFWEAGGSRPDLRHVASVIHNRYVAGQPDATWESVCLQPRAFSCWNRRDQSEDGIERYRKQAEESDAELWFACVQVAMVMEDGEFNPTTTATHYWQHGAPGVTAGMAAMPEVARTKAHTYRVEK